MEMADGIIINKADGNNVEGTVGGLRISVMRSIFSGSRIGWTPQVLTYSGFYNIGVKEIWDMVYAYIDFVRQENGYFEHRRNRQAKYWMYETINEHLRDSFYPESGNCFVSLAGKDVLEGRATSFSAARKLLGMYFSGLKQENE